MHPNNIHLQSVWATGLTQMPKALSPTQSWQILFIYHTCNIRSLIRVQDKTTAKLLDHREKLLRHLSRWWKQHCPLTFAGSRSIMRWVRQEGQRVPAPPTSAVCSLRSPRLLSISVGSQGLLITGDMAERATATSASLPCCILISPVPWLRLQSFIIAVFKKLKEGFLHFTSLTGRNVEHPGHGVWWHCSLFAGLLGTIAS